MGQFKFQLYPNQKYILFLLLILRYPLDKEHQEINKFESHIRNDIKNCPTCFQNQSNFCTRVHQEYEFDEHFINNLNILFGTRQNRVLRNKKDPSRKIFAKYLARDFNFSEFNGINDERVLIKRLTQRFLNESRLDGMQYCPKSGINRFIEFFAKNFTELNTWMHMNVNVETLLLPFLYSIGFPVPKTYATCGFTIFQSVDGIPLANLYATDFITKLIIARHLLKSALVFSEGFNGFRIYITDLSMDNVAYNAKEDKVSFIDLDTVLIVDSHKNSQSKVAHRHEFLECFDCFAFSPSEICESQRSDMNIFSVCQLLREDLRRDRKKGFLYPVPTEYLNLESMLNECVSCRLESCENRYRIADDMIKNIDNIIKSNSYL